MVRQGEHGVTPEAPGYRRLACGGFLLGVAAMAVGALFSDWSMWRKIGSISTSVNQVALAAEMAFQAGATLNGRSLPTFGFFFPVRNELLGVLRVVRQVRRHYPTSQILLRSDGGTLDFRSLCKLPHYRCKYRWAPSSNMYWNPHSWLRRLREAAKALDTTYVIILEVGMQVHHRHYIEPQHDAGGLHDGQGPALQEETIAYIERLGRERNACFDFGEQPRARLVGGSYFRQDALLDALLPSNLARIDFAGLLSKEGEKILNSETALLIALSCQGWSVHPWREIIGQVAKGRRLALAREEEMTSSRRLFDTTESANLPEAAFEHRPDDSPEAAANEEEEREKATAVEQKASSFPDVKCRGCVWYSLRDRSFAPSPLPIPAQPPSPLARYTFASGERRAPLPSGCSLAPSGLRAAGGQRQSQIGPSLSSPSATVKSLAAREGPLGTPEDKATYGFYFPIYNQIPGTLGVVGQVRRFYPDSPIHLLQDGYHYDFSRVCELPKYGCTYEWVPAQNSRWNPHSWFRRMRSAAERLQTTFVIYLEPDMLVRQRHTVVPPFDAGGIYDNYNPTMHEETAIYLEKKGREIDPCFKLKWKHFGLAGGSYFRTAALLDAFDPVHVSRIDWEGILKTETITAASSDFAMLVALACRGYTVYPWAESAQNFLHRGLPADEEGRKDFQRMWPAYNPEAAFEHDHKEHYYDPVPSSEDAKIERTKPTKQIDCQGCVWYTGDNLDVLLPIGSKPPKVALEQDIYQDHPAKLPPRPAHCLPAKPQLGAVPLATAATVYKPFAEKKECGAQAYNFGHIATLWECDRLTLAKAECGTTFMFSQEHPDWACRCCEPDGAEDGPNSDFWDVYSISAAQSQASASRTASTGASMVASASRTASTGASMVARVETVSPSTAAVTNRGFEEAQPEHAAAAGSGGPAAHGSLFRGSVPRLADSSTLYKPYASKKECSSQGINFGFIKTLWECDRLTAASDDCGNHFMFSMTHPDWACRCCELGGEDDGPNSDVWDVFAVQSVTAVTRTTTTPEPRSGAKGLPILPERPDWLVKDDGLVIDARPSRGGGMLILQAVLMDQHGDWGKKKAERPRWLRAMLSTNRAHARKHGHAMVLRWKASEPMLTPWQLKQCEEHKWGEATCRKTNERENINWEKHLMMSEYLLSAESFTHIIMLDADAALVHAEHDTLRDLAAQLIRSSIDLFLSDEDWLLYGKGRINGGLLFAKNNDFTQKLFQDTFDAHVLGPVPLAKWRIGVENMPCGSNEQVCLNDLWQGSGKAIFAHHAMIASGKIYNRGGCVLHFCGDGGGSSDPSMKTLGMADPALEVMHFMGSSKGAAEEALCNGVRDFTGEGPEGYGCAP